MKLRNFIIRKKTYILSDTSSFYESIRTEDTYWLFLLKIKYLLKGYKTFKLVPIRLVLFIYKHFSINIWHLYETNLTFEKRIKGSDQVTFWSPYSNFM